MEFTHKRSDPSELKLWTANTKPKKPISLQTYINKIFKRTEHIRLVPEELNLHIGTSYNLHQSVLNKAIFQQSPIYFIEGMRYDFPFRQCFIHQGPYVPVSYITLILSNRLTIKKNNHVNHGDYWNYEALSSSVDEKMVYSDGNIWNGIYMYVQIAHSVYIWTCCALARLKRKYVRQWIFDDISFSKSLHIINRTENKDQICTW